MPLDSLRGPMLVAFLKILNSFYKRDGDIISLYLLSLSKYIYVYMIYIHIYCLKYIYSLKYIISNIFYIIYVILYIILS